MKTIWYMTAVPVADMWKRPAFESERVNQTLYGEFLRRDIKRGKYLRVFTQDSYVGWIRDDHLVPVSADMSDLKPAVVKSFLAEIYQSAGSNNHYMRLSFGSRVLLDSAAKSSDKSNSRIKLSYPEGWIDRDHLRFTKPTEIAISTLLKTFKLFLGVPYLWGGRSSYGLDCSGLVQLVAHYFGFELPRDSKDLRVCGDRIAKSKLEPCDLIFSPGHVAVYAGKDRFIHASQKTGRVSIESLDPGSKSYRPDIAEQIDSVRRVF
jgi:hypothetical protein